ncbi:MAG: hypothetical protein WBB28_22140 [Crinalium sp.]
MKPQTYPAELVEYLLIDNNSSDRTASIIQESSHQQINLRLIFINIKARIAASKLLF